VPNPGSLPGLDPVQTPVERFSAQLERTADRLRTLGIARLGAPFDPEPTRADAARAEAQRLADNAAGLEGRPTRALPRLADAAVGDQVAVCGRDLLAAAQLRDDEADVVRLLDAAARRLLDLRRRV